MNGFYFTHLQNLNFGYILNKSIASSIVFPLLINKIEERFPDDAGDLSFFMLKALLIVITTYTIITMFLIAISYRSEKEPLISPQPTQTIGRYLWLQEIDGNGVITRND